MAQLFTAALACLSCSAQDTPQLAAAIALVGRVLPAQQAARFTISITESVVPSSVDINRTSGGDPPRDGVFSLPKPSFSVAAGSNETVALSGTSGVAVASALNRYLTDVAGGQVNTWFTHQLPSTLPPPTDSITVTSPYALSHYLNVCAFGYSTAWWDWARWEKEIDWMALNGVNAPLAMVGQDAIWLDVFVEDFGLDRAELIDNFFAAPSYQPWHWMGNLNGYRGSPAHGTTEAFMRRQLELQKKIVSRMVSLGMTPVLTGFAGHVPASLVMRYPSARVTHLPAWHGHMVNGTYTLDPTDPLFVKIGSAFVTRQLAAMTGTGWEVGSVPRLYLADPYNEMLPPSIDPAYIRNVSTTIFQGMSAADSNAVWVAQAWFLGSAPAAKPSPRAPWGWDQLDAFLNGPPLGKLLMLDLNAVVNPVWRKTKGFLGVRSASPIHTRGIGVVPFLWCAIENFGGRSGMFSSGLDNIATAPITALHGTGVVDVTYQCVHFSAEDEAKCAGLPPAEAVACEAGICEDKYNASFSHDRDGNKDFPGCGTCWCCAVSSNANSTVRMLGVGMTPEGIETNPLVFSLIAETFWHNTSIDVEAWMRQYTLSRRGLSSAPPPNSAAGKAADDVSAAVALLARTVYNASSLGWSNQGTVGSAIASQPSFHPRIPDTSVTPYANATDLMQAWRLLLGASSIDPTGTTTGMLYDVIDVGQMVGSAVFLGHLKDLEVAFNARNTSGVQSAGKALLATVADVDALLHTSPNHLFGTYLLSAETSGNSADEISMFRTAAKRLVTLWGYPMANGTAAQTSHNSGLSEYAYRLWAGLVSTYYQPRWTSFVAALEAALASGKGPPFDQAAFDADVLHWELEWISNASVNSAAVGTAAIGDTIKVATGLLDKWEAVLRR